MLKERFTSFINGATAYGIDLNLKANGNFTFYLVELSLKKQEVNIVLQQQGTNIEELVALELNKDIPIYVNLRGKGVLSKKVNSSIKTGLELLNLALPNVNAEEFYFYGESCTPQETWVQFTRKELLNEWIKQFKDVGSSVLKVQLEFTALNTINTLFQQQRIQIDTNQLIFTEGRLQRIEQAEAAKTTIQLEEEELDTDYLVAYANAFAHFSGTSSTVITLANEQKEYKQRKLFSWGIKFALGFFLLLLLANFFLFQNYSTQYGQLSQTLEVNRSQLDRLKKLEIEKKNKEQFFLTTDLISVSNSSYLADRLALNKPKGITWSELNINPSKQKIERGEEIEFNIKTINLSGTTPSSTLLNEWIAALNQEKWVKSINIKGFQKLENKRYSKFSLQIIVK